MNSERIVLIASLLPADADAGEQQRLHEATVLDELLDPSATWATGRLQEIHKMLRVFLLCPVTRCQRYVRKRTRSPFAGMQDAQGSLNDRVALLRLTLRAYEKRQGLAPASRGRLRLLVAAYLLLLERPTTSGEKDASFF